MPTSRPGLRLSFQTKVLVVVLVFLVLVPAIIVWFFDRHITAQTETEAQRTLATADAVFRNSCDIRTRNLVTRFRNVVNEPRFKAVAQLGDPATLSASLRESLDEYGEETEWLLFSTPDTPQLAGARRAGAPVLEACVRAATPVAQQAGSGEPDAAMVAVDGRIYTIVAVPVFVRDRGALLGTLTIGVRFGDRALQELTSLTRTEILVQANDHILVSSLARSDLDAALAPVTNATGATTSVTPVRIEQEHFLARSGAFEPASITLGLRYVLLSSYEARLVALARTRWILVLVSITGIGLSAFLVRLLIGRIMQPLRALRDGAEAVGRGDFTRRVEARSHDECGELAASFNRMTSSIQQSHAELETTVTELRATQDQLMQREHRLRESEEGLRLIIESARDHVIFTLDRNGRVRRWNAAAERLLGYNADEAAGLAYASFFTAEDRANARPAELLAAAATEGRHGFEGWRVRRDGSRFWADVTVSSLPDPTGASGAGYVEIARDITVRRETEDALRQARDAAEAGNRAKSEFLANMSHEIRTPMNAVLGLTSLLLDQKMPAQQLEVLGSIRGSAEAMLALIDDLLDLSKLEAGSLAIHRQDFDLRTCAERVAADAAAGCLKKSLAFELRVAPDVPPIVSTDGPRLRQVLTNLVGNAVKFTERGRIELAIARAPEVSADHVRCTVTDTGIGIPHERMNGLFKPFFQVESSAARRFGGTGLGLALAKRLVELLGGTINCESTPNQGSRFSFTVRAPVATYDRVPPKPVATIPGSAAIKPAAPSQVNFADRHPMRVLVVEDNPINTKVLTLILAKLGYKADTAINGIDALTKLDQQRHDVVFMDLQMPEMDGLEATRRLRTRVPVTQPPYIMAFTANATPEDRGACVAAGMHDFESKPASVEKIARALERAFAWLTANGSPTSGT